MLFLFLLLPTLAVSSTPPSPTPLYHLKFSETNYTSRVSFYRKGIRQWSRAIGYDTAFLFPRQRLVVYQTEDVTVGRRFDGRQAWVSDAQITGGVCGRNVLICNLFAGVWGVAIYDVLNWPEIYESQPLAAYDVRSGKQLWGSNMKAFGDPIWTNGKVFIAVRMHLTRLAVRRAAQRKGRVPVWLEERSVHTGKLLWCRRLTGYPPGLSRVIPHRGQRVTLVFTRRGDVPFGDEYPAYFQRYLPSLRVTVPVHSGPTRDSQPPIAYWKRDWVKEEQ